MTWISSSSSFGHREFISMESLFKENPHGYLVILSKTMDSDRGLRILKLLLDHGFRVLAAEPDLPFLFKDIRSLKLGRIKSSKQDPNKIPLAQNLSNLTRLVILYKYGDDFSGLRNSIRVKSIDATSNWTRLNNVVLVFNKNHSLLYKFMEEFESNFDGNR
ncbi:hypothetical protein HYC85_022156 [Camellia sinensis]|uniref:Uncharacterized protein n=1 Tax=Camellia sinensis TaxID=4442 RepID=A0A7J7GJK4_CAMSI|nr:hypothetical protein HYC85_022156 [Camellia sinensis]